MKRLYFDYAATTPLDDGVRKIMRPYLNRKKGLFGNASSLHREGQRAHGALERARFLVARSLTASQDDIFFTASATEANNLVIRGVLKKYFRDAEKCNTIPTIVISDVEHSSVRETVADLERDGSARIVRLGVSADGVVDVDQFKSILDSNVILISIMWVNNETGALQPIRAIADVIKDFRKKSGSTYPFFHCDGAQAAVLFDPNVVGLGVDGLTLSSHKMYGPLGVGALFLNHQLHQHIAPLITGGGQEGGLRSGTVNVAGVVGFGKAFEKCFHIQKKENKRLLSLSNYFIDRLLDAFPFAIVHSSLLRSPHIVNFFIPDIQDLAMRLDGAGLAVSSGSACSGRRALRSQTLVAMGCDEIEVKESVRFSFGRYTTQKEVDEALKRIIMTVRN